MADLVLVPTTRAGQVRQRPADRRCPTLASAVTLGAVSGRRIELVLVVRGQPAVAGPLGGWADRLHARTRPRVLRHELVFAAGDTVDSLRIAESLRVLRALPYLQCAHDPNAAPPRPSRLAIDGVACDLKHWDLTHPGSEHDVDARSSE